MPGWDRLKGMVERIGVDMEVEWAGRIEGLLGLVVVDVGVAGNKEDIVDTADRDNIADSLGIGDSTGTAHTVSVLVSLMRPILCRDR